jgi:LacI family transcriptional regulator
MGKITMKDVAKHAGVSVATVSNVINNISNKTTEATKQKVLSSVKELNYKMDMTARSLSIGKSNLIGIFIPEVYENSAPSSLLKTNPFYSEIISGIEYEARMLGYDILISCIHSIDHALELVNKRMLDGLAILGTYDTRFWEDIKLVSVPIVLIDNYKYEAVGVNNVGIDDELGAYLATKHLTTLGHKHIAFATSEVGVSEVNEKRFIGFKRAIKEAKLDPTACPVIVEAVSFKGGITIGHRLLKDHMEVTAVFAIADIMALGIIKIMHQFGRKIPEDLSIIGFDDLSICEYTFPALTTIRQDIYKKGVEVARLLIKKIDGELGLKSQELPVELIVRETTKAILR